MNPQSAEDDPTSGSVEFTDTLLYAATASIVGLVLGYLLRPGFAAVARDVRGGDVGAIPLLSAAAGWYLDSPGNPLIVALVLALLAPAVYMLGCRLRNRVRP